MRKIYTLTFVYFAEIHFIYNEINEKIKLSKVKITNKNGEEAIGKPIGNYITIDVKGLKLADDDKIKKMLL